MIVSDRGGVNLDRAQLVERLHRGAVVDFGAPDLALVVVAGEERDAHECSKAAAIARAAAHRIRGVDRIVIVRHTYRYIAGAKAPRQLAGVLRGLEAALGRTHVRARLDKLVDRPARASRVDRRPRVHCADSYRSAL